MTDAMTFYTAREDALTSRFERLVAGWTGPGPAPRHRGGPEGHVFLWDDLLRAATPPGEIWAETHPQACHHGS